MNKTKLLSIAVIGLLLLNFGILGMIFFHHPRHDGPPPPPMGGPGPHEGPKMIIIDKLQMDENQQKQYELLIKDHRSKMEEMNKTSRELKDELYSLLKEEKIDSVKTNEVIQKIGDNQKRLENVNFDHFSKIKALCKPEQIKLFDNLVDELTELFSPGPPRR